MLERSSQRAKVYDAWRIGEPYSNREYQALETRIDGQLRQRPLQPLGKSHNLQYTESEQGQAVRAQYQSNNLLQVQAHRRTA